MRNEMDEEQIRIAEGRRAQKVIRIKESGMDLPDTRREADELLLKTAREILKKTGAVSPAVFSPSYRPFIKIKYNQICLFPNR